MAKERVVMVGVGWEGLRGGAVPSLTGPLDPISL